VSGSPTSAAEAEAQAERIRKELAGTIDQLKTNLLPRQLASEALETARYHTPDWLLRYWALARSPVGMAIIGAASVGLVGGIVTKRQGRW
jgi:hypothetical protein